MDCPRAGGGLFTDCPRTVHAHPIDCPREPHGLSVHTQRTLHGHPTDGLSTIHPIVCSRTVHGLHTNCSRSAHAHRTDGLSTDFPRAIHGRPTDCPYPRKLPRTAREQSESQANRQFVDRDVDNPWTVCPWGVHGKSVGGQRPVRGQSMDYPSVGYPWTVREQSVDSPWVVHGQSAGRP